MVALSQAQLVVCQPFFHRYSGSEVITLELAEAFASRGSDVTVVTWSSSELMRDEVSKISRASLVDLRSESARNVVEALKPDLIWSHQGFIPLSLINSPSRFVFAHLSSFNSFEFPFVPQIERQLADRIYFVSQEARDVHLDTGIYSEVPESKFRILDNPAPQHFHDASYGLKQRANTPRSLLVVSNHIPQEIAEAIRLLRSLSVSVDVIGVADPDIDSHQERVTADLLSGFDAVMTIGKTVQYSLCAGLPVYCYDYFGGPGWLTADNIEIARYHNFSGRGFTSRSAQVVVEELQTGFSAARLFVDERRNDFRNEFSYDRLISDIADLLDQPVDETRGVAPSELLGYARAHETIGDFGTAYYGSQPDLERLRTEVRLTKVHAANLEAILCSEQDRRVDVERRLAEIEESASWRLTAPLRSILRVTRRR